MSDAGLKTVAAAAKELQIAETEIIAACTEALGKPDVAMLSPTEIEQLGTHFAEKRSAKGASHRSKSGGGRATVGRQPKSRVGNIQIEQRKVRGAARRERAAANRLKVEQEQPAPSASAAPAPSAPPPPPAAVEVTAEASAVASSSVSSMVESTSAVDQIHARQQEEAKKKADLKEAELLKVQQEQAAAAAAANPQSDIESQLKRTGTITINPDQVKKREKRMRKRRKLNKSNELRKQDFVMPQQPKVLTIDLPEEISIKQLSYLMAVKTTQVLEKLSEFLDFDEDTPPEFVKQEEAALVVEEFGHDSRKVFQNKSADFVLNESQAVGNEFEVRPPVVTVMGHVDHGKTSLLDYIRKSKVVNTESGGITQHIGAYQAEVQGSRITFIDTPGHEVFTEMRARGARVTDLVILVVAADDGVQPQTREAIAHANSAKVPIIVAINKMDLATANPENVKQQLAGHALQAEDWGGDTVMVPVSAETGEGVDKLLESVLLSAELLELKAALDIGARGTIIEVKTEKGLGVVISLIVKDGVLRKGDFILCDTEYGKVRAMRDENGKIINEATPSTPVQIQGISELPNVGADFYVAKDENSARIYAEEQRNLQRQRELSRNHEIIEANDLDELFAMVDARKESKVLNLIVKTDVAGTAEAMEKTIAKIGNDEASMKIIHSGVGAISESDVLLAQASDATLVGFRVTANPKARRQIQDRKISAFYSDVFYEVTDHLTESLLGLLEPIQEEHVRGAALVKEVFHINKVGKVAGCAVEDGSIETKKPVRVVRDGKVIFKTEISQLRHYKENVRQVAAGSDCGIFLTRFSDFKPGDIIESYEVTVTARTL